MATVTDYASLSQAVSDWFSRSDLPASIDYFIQAAEARIYWDILANNQGRGTKEFETVWSDTIAGDGTLAVPTGYLGIKYAWVQIGQSQVELVRVNPSFIFGQYPNRQASRAPKYIARQDATHFCFGPAPDSNYAVGGVYWQRETALSASHTTSWMTASIPTILLSACNHQAALFLKNDGDAGDWDSRYSAQLSGYIAADKAESMSGSAMRMVAG